MFYTATKEFQEIIIRYLKDSKIKDKSKNMENYEIMRNINLHKNKESSVLKEDLTEFREINSNGDRTTQKFKTLNFEIESDVVLDDFEFYTNLDKRKFKFCCVDDDYTMKLKLEKSDKPFIAANLSNRNKLSINLFSKFNNSPINFKKNKNNKLLINSEDILPIIEDANSIKTAKNKKQYVLSSINKGKSIKEMKNYLIKKLEKKIESSQSIKKNLMTNSSLDNSKVINENCSRIKNLFHDDHTKKVMIKIQKQTLQEKFLTKINNLEQKLQENIKESLKEINKNISASDDLKSRYLYLIKKNFV